MTGDWGAYGVTVRHGRVTALDDVTLPLPTGEVAALVGGDGAGKTTLLKTLVGTVVPESGRIAVPPLREIGFMPTSGGVWRDLSVDENVAFVAAAHRLRGQELSRRRDELLGSAGLDAVGGRLAGQLSGGMRQKLAFCLAMLHRPRLLVLDEPSTGVDPVSRVELWRMIARAAADGAAVAMATTYLDEAERAAHVLVLDSGRVLARGTPDEITAGAPGTVTVVDGPVQGSPSGEERGQERGHDREPGEPGASGPSPERSWRRGPAVHTWHPGPPRPGERPLTTDMEDAVIAAALADRERRAP